MDFGSSFTLLALSRLGFSILFGAVLGFEREVTGKFAGLRTHILVTVGACAFTILSKYGFMAHNEFGYSAATDTARVSAQIVTGIGFIGAGTVMRYGTNVLGITTAATLWVCAAVGMACGAGLFSVAAIASVASLIVLVLIRKFERNFLSRKTCEVRHLKINIWTPISSINDLNDFVEEKFSQISSLERKIVNNNNESYFVTTIRLTSLLSLNDINIMFSEKSFITRFEIKEICE